MDPKNAVFPTLRLAILQQSYGRFGGAERLAFSHFVQLKKMGKDVIAQSFFQPNLDVAQLSSKEDDLIRALVAKVKQCLLVSSSSAAHFTHIAEIMNG